MLAEDRLDLTVEATRLGPGEAVMVVTKMGREVARGVVGESIPNGPISILVKEQVEKGVAQTRLYDPALYSFVPIEGDQKESSIEPDEDPGLDVDAEPPDASLQELPADERAEAKLISLGLNLHEQPQPPGGGAGSVAESEPPASMKTPKNGAPKNGNGSGVAPDPSANVDVSGLPDQVKKKIIGVKGLDESQRNQVMSEISDAALRSLRNVGVKDVDIYKTVAKIQEAVSPVLEQKG